MHCLWVSLAALLLGVIAPTLAENQESCVSLRQAGILQSSLSPYEVFTNKRTYIGGEQLLVTVKVNKNNEFSKLLIQARRYNTSLDTTEPIGYFTAKAGYEVACPGIHGNGLVSQRTSGGAHGKSTISFTWTAPLPAQSHIVFRASVVGSHSQYWIIKSPVVVDLTAPVAPVISKPPPTPLVAIETNSCGKTKGCYRNPAGCKEPDCDAVVTWRIRDDKVEFELAAATEGWVAVGFSSDKKMGHDDVIECVWNETRNLLHQAPIEVRLSRNGGGKSNQMTNSLDRYIGLSHIVGSRTGRRLRCKFWRDRFIPGYEDLVNLDDDNYILLAKGKVDLNGMKKMHVLEPGKQPYVSKSMVSMKEIVDISGTARYPLAKIHGILMLIGWMMCASTALVIAKYYKPMWPNSRLCNEKVWFAVHRGCMSVTFFCTILGFILIFIHAGGYSQMPNLPDKAHPILGIITTIFCILNPILAMCRCNEKSRNRPIFNWLHWFVGLVATVLATPTMFIGLNLAKAHVPWWTTWVMVAFMLFHLIIELLLEIHGCINGRKQKKREEEFMLRKKHDPRGELFGREPEPVGHHFKKRIITVYLFVVIILGLVMIISVAAG